MVFRRLATLATLLFGIGNPGLADEAEVPRSLSWVSARAGALGFDQHRLEAMLGSYAEDIAAGKLPGVNLMISRQGQVVLKASIGFADVAARRELEFQHLFRLYSMTKPIASVLSLQQAEAGLYTLDGPVEVFLPEFANYKVQGGVAEGDMAAMTVRHLLTHTAGFSAVWNDDPVARLYRRDGVVEYLPNDFENAPASLAEFYSRISALPLLHTPGTQRTYGVSNDVQGVLIERAAKERLPSLLERALLDPLAMSDTGFCVPQDDLHRLVSLYAYGEDGRLARRESGQDSAYQCPVAMASLSGGLVGSISDYWRFAEALRQGGALDGGRILSLKSTRHLFAPQPDIDEGDEWIQGAEWGLGLAVVVDPARSLRAEVKGNIYWTGSANTSFWIDPEHALVALLFTQVRGSREDYEIQSVFRNRVYAAFKPY